MRLLLAPGASLGGARPESSVRDADGTLVVATFSSPSDEMHIVRWEAVALGLARRAGLDVPDSKLTQITSHFVLLTKRFDRRATTRVPFLSAMSLLDAADGDRRSYVEMADALRPAKLWYRSEKLTSTLRRPGDSKSISLRTRV